MTSLIELADAYADSMEGGEMVKHRDALVAGIEKLQAEVDRLTSADNDAKTSAVRFKKERQEWGAELDALRAELGALKAERNTLVMVNARYLLRLKDAEAELDALKSREPVAWAKFDKKRARLTAMNMNGEPEWVPLVKQAAPQAPANTALDELQAELDRLKDKCAYPDVCPEHAQEFNEKQAERDRLQKLSDLAREQHASQSLVYNHEKGQVVSVPKDFGPSLNYFEDPPPPRGL